ncbi:MAG: low molecular weight protein-tyrosine-phosphatase [Steroidobacteraceae bacterium]|jgi:protein-tyrosine phosphatase|nr:low molecular weight phosphotyrosine protein phosphatase [Gammaproteobacteria bacterium]
MRVLCVCMGNICRSPTAEAVLRELARREAPELTLEVDSAGTHGYHVGDPPDPRAVAAAARRGYDLSPLRARQFTAKDFERFDLILAMDEDNRATMLRQGSGRVELLLSYAPQWGERNVPDPYYGGEAGFERVLDLIESAARGVIESLGQMDASSASR